MTHVLKTCDPNNYADGKGEHEWEKDMLIEIVSLLNNHTLDLVPLLQGMNIMKFLWVYKTKFTSKGVV